MKASVEYLRSAIQDFRYDYSAVQMHPDEVFDGYVDRNSYDILWVTEPLLCNLRLERQKGTFLLAGNIKKRIAELLPSALPPESIHKLVIPTNLAGEVFRMLRSMGIDNSRLFSDIDGLARDVKHMMAHQVPNKWIELSMKANDGKKEMDLL